MNTVGEGVDKIFTKNYENNNYPFDSLEITVSIMFFLLYSNTLRLRSVTWILCQLLFVLDTHPHITICFFIFLQLNCCGVEDYKDHGGKVPSTCCGIPRWNVQGKCEKDVYTKRPGCGTLLKEFWKSNINLVRGVGVAISLLETGFLWIVFTLLRKYRNA